MHSRVMETWTKDAVWRKLSAFCNLDCLRNHLGRENKNEKDIVFAIKTAKSFLCREGEDLPTSMIECYYGIFWILSAMVMLRQQDVYLSDLSGASSSGHGLMLSYDQYPENPEEWRVYIQNNGFMKYLLSKAPFENDISEVALPHSIGKSQVRKEPDKYESYAYTFDDLMSRIPEMEWHYELLRKRVAPLGIVEFGRESKLRMSKLAKTEWINKIFPNIEIVGLDELRSNQESKNVYTVKPKAEFDTTTSGIRYSSLMTDVNLIAKLDKPLDTILLWHFIFSYGWSIIARYTPDYLQEIDSGKMGSWKPFLDEYFWLVRIIIPTECLNSITRSEWVFSPPAVLG